MSMGVLDNFLKSIQLNQDVDDYDDDSQYSDIDEYDEENNRSYYDDKRRGSDLPDDDDVVTPIRQKNSSRQEGPVDRFDERPKKSQPAFSGANNSGIRQVPGGNNRSKKGGAQSMEICSIKPTSMDDTREVTLTLLQNRAVILNLEGLDVEVAQRIVDFVSGSCFAIKGNLQKISRYIFIITPHNVDVSGDFLETVGGGLSATAGSQLPN